MFNSSFIRDLSGRISNCAFLFLIMLTLTLSGCKLNMSGGTQAWWKKPICELPSSPTKEDVITRINHQVSKVNSWRCEQTKIRIKGGPLGIPMGLNADVAVEKPKNFRMTISHSITSREGDIGSNDEQFWFWGRRMDPKYLFTCSHDDTQIAREKLQLPFEMNWLMEVMGVSPLDPEDFILQIPETRNGILSLVSNSPGINGQSFKRVIFVDACYGRVIAHELRDPYDKVIAHADLNEYKRIREADVVMPHQVDLIVYQPNGPQMEMQINLKKISVNLDSRMLANRWTKPHYNGYPEFDIGQNFRKDYPLMHASNTEKVPSTQQTKQYQKAQLTSQSGKRPPWVKNGSAEFIIGDNYNSSQFANENTRQINNELTLPEDEYQEDDVLIIPDEPNWAE